MRTPKAAVKAANIIVATNVPTLPLMARGGYCLLEYPKTSYIVSGRLGKTAQKGMYISPDKHHYSILPIDVAGAPTLLVGGEGHLPGVRLNSRARYRRLAAYAQKNFGIGTFTNQWHARDYLAYDQMPLVGKLYPWSKHVYVGTAMMKWGLTNGTVAGVILSDLIQGKPNPWAATFDSMRLANIAAIPRSFAGWVKSLFSS